MDSDEAKRRAAERALEYLPDAGVIGLGSGTTAYHFILGVAELVRQGRAFRTVATSQQSRTLAVNLGLDVLSDEGPWAIDVCVDGADEVSQDLDLIKGGGGAHTREKIVNCWSRTNIIIVDASKLSQKLGALASVPVEVLPFGHRQTANALTRFGACTLRYRDEKCFRTDGGNYIYDLAIGVIDDPKSLERELHQIPGVVETGLFCGRAQRVIVGAEDTFELVRA